jgi:D-arabinose 5-phosphate isomerase GutQ
MDAQIKKSLKKIEGILNKPDKIKHPTESIVRNEELIIDDINKRTQSLSANITKTVSSNLKEINEVINLFLSWMQNGTIVRVIGAGRARLAAAIPANRLAHGGARVFVQDDIVPMPHTAKGGGIIAASASGETNSVLEIMELVHESAPHITIVGIAKSDAQKFKSLCHHFIGIKEDSNYYNPLRALADMGEYVISEVLDAIVVAAGKIGDFDDRRWRLGHENIGGTGPYDVKKEKPDLLLNERFY